MVTNATPTQDSLTLPAEAGFSTNLFLTHPIMGRQQFTFRGTTSTDWGVVLEDVGRFLHFMRDKGWLFDGERSQAEPSAPSQPKEPTYQPIDDSGNDKPTVNKFTVERLSIDTHDGKHFYKVIGGKFSQYGVAVWPEVLEAANIKIDHATGQLNTSVSGWTAEYAEFEKDGKTRRKVTRLSPI